MAARVDCPKTTVPGPYPASGFAGLAVTLTASDTGNFNSFKPTGRDILLVYGGAAGGTYTIQSAPDAQGRTGDFTTLTISALAIHSFLFNQLAGWLQSDGTVWIKGSAAGILFGVLSYPG
jgi:hypothetical protein